MPHSVPNGPGLKCLKWAWMGPKWFVSQVILAPSDPWVPHGLVPNDDPKWIPPKWPGPQPPSPPAHLPSDKSISVRNPSPLQILTQSKSSLLSNSSRRVPQYVQVFIFSRWKARNVEQYLVMLSPPRESVQCHSSMNALLWLCLLLLLSWCGLRQPT